MYGLFVNGKLVIMGDHAEQLRDLAPSGAEVQVVQLMQPVGKERDFYSMVAYVAECPNASPVDISMEFNISLGTTLKIMARLETFGFVKSTLVTENGFKQVRRYRAA